MENEENKLRHTRQTITINKISEATKKSFKTRLISALVALAIIIPALIIGDWAYFVLIVLALLIGVIELIRCAKTKYSRWAYLATFILCLAIIIWPLIGRFIDG